MLNPTSIRTRTALATISGVLAVAGISVGAASAVPTAAPATASAAGSATSARPTVQLDLAASSPQLAACFPRATATVKVALTTDAIGKDTFTIRAAGLEPRTDFTVFLIEEAGAPFGAVEYIGDFTTDRYGRADNRFTLIVEEAFAFDDETGVRDELNSVGFWFADPAADDGCLGVQSPVTPFDGDASAGVQMMNSGTRLLP